MIAPGPDHKIPVDSSREATVAVITIDNPPVNALDRSLRASLLKAFEDVARDSSLQAVVLMCAGRTFVAGADIREFDTGMGPPGYHELLELIEGSEKPVVAALHGTALGAGVELALACHYRVATVEASLGLPELSLGIIPGAGGTQRLPRLIDMDSALDLILSGKPINASKALQLGLVDETTSGSLREAAIAFARRMISAEPRRTCDQPVRLKAADTFARTREELRSNPKSRAAQFAAVDALEAAATVPFKEGIAAETRISSNLIPSVEARALRHLFFAERETRRVPGLTADHASLPLHSVGIVGSGTMGGGIAMAFANAGVPTALLDVTQEALDKGLATIRRNYENSLKRGRLSQEQYTQRMSLIKPTLAYSDLAGADLVIEAVIENMQLKRSIFAELDRVCKPRTVLATNTSSLDIDEIAKATSRPGNVLGLHFFSPANVMRLVEIVRGEQTAPEVLATGLEVARRLRKVGVVARVGAGFIGNRMMDPYAREAERLVLEGATPGQVDAALESFGMAMGILAVFDMAGIDVGVRSRMEAKSRPEDPSFYRASAVLFEHGRLGQKTGRGYYRYDSSSRARLPDEEANALIWNAGQSIGIARRTILDEEILERCLYALINEGAKVLSEGIALRASDIDVVYTTGYGFPSYRGGPMFFADTVGLAAIVEKLDQWRAEHGALHWEASSLLRDLASKGLTFADWDREKSARAVAA